MQATPALNETRLPRQVLQRSAAIAERQRAQAESEAASAAPPAPPAEPSAPAATTADPTPPQPPADPRESDPAYWKQRFKVTEGVLRTEREARTKEALEFNQRITELQDQIRTLQASAPAPDLDMGQFLTPEQIDTLGEEEAGAVVKAALKVAQAEVRKVIEAEIKPLRDQRAAEAAATVEDVKTRYKDKLTELMPDWLEIDATEGWLAWLAQEDEGTGLLRQSMLDDYIRKADAVRTAKLFKTYKDSIAPPVPPVAPRGTGAMPSEDLPVPSRGLRPLGPGEAKAFYTKAATRGVTDAERAEFEARRKLPRR